MGHSVARYVCSLAPLTPLTRSAALCSICSLALFTGSLTYTNTTSFLTRFLCQKRTNNEIFLVQIMFSFGGNLVKFYLIRRVLMKSSELTIDQSIDRSRRILDLMSWLILRCCCCSCFCSYCYWGGIFGFVRLE